MKILLLALFLSISAKADIKISQLPLGIAANSSVGDSFPYVDSSSSVTRRIKLSDLINLPTMVSTFANKTGNETFNGAVTASAFNGPLNGNATSISTVLPISSGGTGQITKGAAMIALLPDQSTAASKCYTSNGTSADWQNCTYVLPNPSASTLGGVKSQVLVTNQFMTGIDTSGNPTISQPAFTNISGTAQISQGGTGAVVKSAAFDALSPMTSIGDLIEGSTSGTAIRLAGNTSTAKMFLTQTGTGSASQAHVYGPLVASDLVAAVAPSTSGNVLTSNGSTWTSQTPIAVTYKVPTVQKFTSSSGTYTLPTSPSPLYIMVKVIGGGGGGGSGSATPGSTGGNSTFGTSLLTANGGTGGATYSANGGTGGSATVTTSSTVVQILALKGGDGQAGLLNQASSAQSGGMGGANCLGGAGSGSSGVSALTGGAASTNSGGGGGGGGSSSTATSNGGGGGGAGGCLEALISSPSSSYGYAIGASGAGASTSGATGAGGAGSAGYIEVTEYYQ